MGSRDRWSELPAGPGAPNVFGAPRQYAARRDVMHGPHDLYSDFEAIERAICDQLT
jgi:hypothetical protein